MQATDTGTGIPEETDTGTGFAEGTGIEIPADTGAGNGLRSGACASGGGVCINSRLAVGPGSPVSLDIPGYGGRTGASIFKGGCNGVVGTPVVPGGVLARSR